MSAAASGGEKSLAYRFFQDIALDLSRKELKFPTFLDAALRVRLLVSKQDASSAEVAQAVRGEPLLSARVVSMANSVAVNPSGNTVTDLKSAVLMVGHNAIRSLAASLAIAQIAQAKALEPFAAESRQVWEHSMEVGALAFVLARRHGKVDPEEALFAGLVHDLGHFYLLWRASQFPEMMAAERSELYALVHEWHPGIGAALLQNLGMVERLVRAVDEHELRVFPVADPLTEILMLSDRCSSKHGMAPPPEHARSDAEPPEGSLDEESARVLLAEASEEVRSLLAVLQGKGQAAPAAGRRQKVEAG
ncbi:MAG: HDOD domain-containing protein [Burkholderiales bacterium]|nr:HDOD domain-containing protein [Burkholderiales bacterium]